VEVNQPADGPVTVVVLLEGVEAGVGARADATQELLGATSEIGHLFDSAPLAPFSIGVDSSRATYDRELLVCCRCGDDEAEFGYEITDQVTPADWPVTSLSVRSRLYDDCQLMEIAPLDAEQILLVDTVRRGRITP